MSRLFNLSLIGIMVLTLVGFATFANAEIVEYVYDFDNLPTGNILGASDGWGYGNSSSTNYLNVASGATSPMSGNYSNFVASGTGTNTYERRVSGGDFAFEFLADTDWEISALCYAGPTSNGAVADISFGKYHDDTVDNSTRFGFGTMGNYSCNLQWTILGTGGTGNRTAGAQGYYTIGMSADALGSNKYDIDLWYESTPGDESTRAVFKTYSNVDVDMTQYNLMTLRYNLVSTSSPMPEVDDITVRIGEVPEPSTIALLATGLLGLLAYAWRKRK